MTALAAKQVSSLACCKRHYHRLCHTPVCATDDMLLSTSAVHRITAHWAACTQGSSFAVLLLALQQLAVTTDSEQGTQQHLNLQKHQQRHPSVSRYIQYQHGNKASSHALDAAAAPLRCSASNAILAAGSSHL
jgi:hypothetical protein